MRSAWLIHAGCAHTFCPSAHRPTWTLPTSQGRKSKKQTEGASPPFCCIPLFFEAHFSLTTCPKSPLGNPLCQEMLFLNSPGSVVCLEFNRFVSIVHSYLRPIAASSQFTVTPTRPARTRQQLAGRCAMARRRCRQSPYSEPARGIRRGTQQGIP